MAEQPPNSDPDADTGTPRWVKVFGIISLVVVVLFVIRLVVGGDHGPRRHLPSSGDKESAVQQP